jgi:fatty-acyl-CoA synthase
MSGPYSFDAPFTFGAQLQARAAHPEVGGRTVLVDANRSWTYSDLHAQSVRVAHFLRGRLGGGQPPDVAMFLENRLEILSLMGGCAHAGGTLFGVNTGLRGEVLSGVIQQSGARLLVIDESLEEHIERIGDDLGSIPPENRLVVRSGSAGASLEAALASEVGAADPGRAAPDVAVDPEQPLMVIYTSGTTGLPKGILNNHAKLLLIGMAVSGNLELGPDDRGYACMPLFHSNAMFLGFMPAFTVAGSLAMRDHFSASQFVPDILRFGSTFWNYVGEPVHYVLGALEKQYGSEEEIRRAVTGHPENRLRYALGNGASAPDIERFTRWMGLEDMFELYGSTEAAISTFRKKGDPRGSVGEITDEKVQILSEAGEPCPPAELDANGRITNYAAAVGEICRVAADTSLFQGYFQNEKANQDKYRDGVYHSGDLGHVLMRDGQRFLFFDGRTDDWIRKDGENFSALQVARLIQEHPDVVLAAAYGAPCSVSDELVMVALKLRPGATFDPSGFFAFCDRQVEQGGMDRKWFPDFVRVVEEFEYTQTEKILVRNLKKLHFDRNRLPDAPLYFRQRGDTGFRELGDTEYAALRADFERAEKLDLLDR